MKNWYLIGVGVGILIGLIMVIVSASQKKDRIDYDERQMAARGEAYKVGFFAMAVVNSLISIYTFITGRSIFLTPEMGNFVSVILGVGAFAVAAILKDAFLSLHEKRKPFFACGAVIAVMTGAGTVRFAMEGMLLENGRLSDRSLIAFVLLLWLVILGVLAVHSRKEDKED